MLINPRCFPKKAKFLVMSNVSLVIKVNNRVPDGKVLYPSFTTGDDASLYSHNFIPLSVPVTIFPAHQPSACVFSLEINVCLVLAKKP